MGIDEIWEELTLEISGEYAKKLATGINHFDRDFTFSNFRKSAEYCKKKMEEFGMEEVELIEFKADGKTCYDHNWRVPRAWDVEEAGLEILTPERRKLADWKENPHSLAMYSSPFEGEAEVVILEDSKDLGGKIAFTSRRIVKVYEELIEKGAIGVISDYMDELPERRKWELPEAIQWENAARGLGEKGLFGFMLSPRKGEYLRSLIKKEKVKAKVKVRTKLYEGKMYAVTGVIPGESKEEILGIGHLFEPGAHDNASGSALLMEIARSIRKLIEERKLPPLKRGIRILLTWEIDGTLAWVKENHDKVSRIIAGLNLDMVGGDQGKDKGILRLHQVPYSNPSCTNVLIKNLMKRLSSYLRWGVYGSNGGDALISDPLIGIPTPAIWQCPEKFYHTSEDTPDKLSSFTFEEMGKVGGTFLYFLATAGYEETLKLANEVYIRGIEELLKVSQKIVEGVKRNVVLYEEEMEKEFNFFYSLQEKNLKSLLTLSHERKLVFYIEKLEEKLSKKVEEEKERVRELLDLLKVEKEDAKMEKGRDKLKEFIPERLSFASPNEMVIWRNLPSIEEMKKYRKMQEESRFSIRQALFWCDGKKSLREILELLEIEGEKNINSQKFLEYFQFLEKYGWIKLSKKK